MLSGIKDDLLAPRSSRTATTRGSATSSVAPDRCRATTSTTRPAPSGYYGYFGARAGDPTEGWYSYDLGPWHVVALNSECVEVGGCGVGSPMYQWLQADLAAAGTPCIAAYWHHAPRSSESGLRRGRPISIRWSGLMVGRGVDVLLAGHAHDYERFARLDANGDPSPNGDPPVRRGDGRSQPAELRPAAGGIGGPVQRRLRDPAPGPGRDRLLVAVPARRWGRVHRPGVGHLYPGPPAQALSSGHEFTDVPAWIDEAVSWIAEPDRRPPIASGYPDATYRPDLPITRAQMIGMLHRIAGSPPAAGLPATGLSDVPAWIDTAARWAVAEGIVTGYGDGTFRPDRSITRAEVARMLHRSVGSPPGPAAPRLQRRAGLGRRHRSPGSPTRRPGAAGGHGLPGRHLPPGRPISRGEVTRMLYGLSLG